MDGPPEQRAEQLYRSSYGDYIRDNFDLAIEGFQQLLGRYPRGDLADNAQYWIGESYYRQGRIREATQAFERVIDEYPEGDKVADAMVRKAFILSPAGREQPVAERRAGARRHTRHPGRLESGYRDAARRASGA